MNTTSISKKEEQRLEAVGVRLFAFNTLLMAIISSISVVLNDKTILVAILVFGGLLAGMYLVNFIKRKTEYSYRLFFVYLITFLISFVIAFFYYQLLHSIFIEIRLAGVKEIFESVHF